MIKVKTVISPGLLKKFELLKNPRPLLRPVAFDVLALITERIHEKGQAAGGQQIGTYNNQYLKLRQSKKYNRSGDSKIIVSLTRQLENDWAVLATPQGWGIGFNNPLNAQKMKWVEDGSKPHNVKAHTRFFKTTSNKKTTIKSVQVKSHSNKGSAGKGKIASLTTEEKDYAVNKLKKLLNAEGVN